MDQPESSPFAKLTTNRVRGVGETRMSGVVRSRRSIPACLPVLLVLHFLWTRLEMNMEGYGG